MNQDSLGDAQAAINRALALDDPDAVWAAVDHLRALVEHRARADFAAVIAEKLTALDGFVVTIDQQIQMVDGDWGRRAFKVPPRDVAISVEQGDGGVIKRADALAIIAKVANMGAIDVPRAAFPGPPWSRVTALEALLAESEKRADSILAEYDSLRIHAANAHGCKFVQTHRGDADG